MHTFLWVLPKRDGIKLYKNALSIFELIEPNPNAGLLKNIASLPPV